MVPVILVRYGELGLKGLNRPDFEKALSENIKRALQGLEYRYIHRDRGRIFIENYSMGEEGEFLSRLSRVFGIVSFSPAMAAELELDQVEQVSLEVFRRAMTVVAEGKSVTFKVHATRANKAFPLDSMELNRHLGAHVLKNIPGLSVDVHNPDITLAVEIRDRAYVSCRTLPGPGGLPYGVSGRALLLLSGGIDSPVAGWLAMKRGVEIQAVHFYSFPFTGEKSKTKVIDICKALARWSGAIQLYVVPFAEIQTSIMEHCHEEMRIVVMRRMMFRIAQELAGRHGALALVTGESVGQVASQTLESMRAVNAVTNLPVLRPLAGADKTEIVRLAKEIGTFEISIRPYEDCCTLFAPKHPRTRPQPAEAEAEEAKLDIVGLVRTAVEATEILSVRR
ncbi:MAG TPA: tRNA 4-thiouridine(8) synthase ThiI [Firmicutes bacterium]|nr:tRNA 4-thiouridine(8) synthase ThiI [Bacillota bacterium]